MIWSRICSICSMVYEYMSVCSRRVSANGTSVFTTSRHDSSCSFLYFSFSFSLPFYFLDFKNLDYPTCLMRTHLYRDMLLSSTLHGYYINKGKANFLLRDIYFDKFSVFLPNKGFVESFRITRKQPGKTCQSLNLEKMKDNSLSF